MLPLPKEAEQTLWGSVGQTMKLYRVAQAGLHTDTGMDMAAQAMAVRACLHHLPVPDLRRTPSNNEHSNCTPLPTRPDGYADTTHR